MKFGAASYSLGMKIEEPVEIPPLRYRAIWTQVCWKWTRMAFLTLVGSATFLAYIWHRVHLLPAPVIAVFVVGTILLSTAGLTSELLEAHFRRKIWRWDDRGITFRNRRCFWTAFQCFEVVHGSLQTDLDTFRLQFREHFLTAGIWIEITAHHPDIEALATVAAQHLVDKSKRNRDAFWLQSSKPL